MKTVPLDCDTILTARELGTVLAIDALWLNFSWNALLKANRF